MKVEQLKAELVVFKGLMSNVSPALAHQHSLLLLPSFYHPFSCFSHATLLTWDKKEQKPCIVS